MANSSNQFTTVSMSSSETVGSGRKVKTSKGREERPRVIVEVDIVESKFRAAWRNPLSDLSLLNAPLFAEWQFEGLRWGGRSAGQPKAHKLRNQVKKKTTAANIMEFERAIPHGVRGTFWW